MTRKQALLTLIITCLTFLAGGFLFNWHKVFPRRYSPKPLDLFRSLIEEIAETIIPATETPGAKDAKVVNYIINVMERCTSGEERRNFLLRLEELQNYSFKRFSARFEDCTSDAKIAVLKHFETRNSFTNPLINRIKRKIWGESFFEQMKRLVVSGYCTSKLGVTQGLMYDPVPVEYLTCIPYYPNQRSWATK